MAVNSEQRDESKAQFLETAADLAEFSLRACKKFPQRWGREITDCIRADAMGVLRNAKKANSIWVRTAEDAKMRRSYMMAAHASLQSLVSTIGMAERLFPLCGYLNRDENGKKKKDLTQKEKERLEAEEKARSRKTMERWMSITMKENNLLKATIQSEWDRYCKLK